MLSRSLSALADVDFKSLIKIEFREGINQIGLP